MNPQHSWRDVALHSQGLPGRAHFGGAEQGVRRAIEHLGYLQIDTISVVARSHHHTLWNRVPGYEPQLLDAVLADRSVFEHWAHAAAYLPMQDYRFAQVLMREMRAGKTNWVRSTDKRLMKKVRKRIEAEGPLRSRDFESKTKATRGWWDWKPTKRALEQLFMQGDLMISGREGFQKLYDLRERVLPADIDTRFPTTIEYAQYLIDQQLRAFGIAKPSSFTYLRRGRELRRAVTEVLEERLRSGQLRQVTENDAQWLVSVDLPSVPPAAGLSILSPFDNLVIQRERLSNLFNFDYVLECYVPQGKRRYGYFSLPVLHGNRFVARIDCKAHRKTRLFEVKSLHWEDGQQALDVIPELGQELLRFARFNGCRKVTIDDGHEAGAGSGSRGANRPHRELADYLLGHPA